MRYGIKVAYNGSGFHGSQRQTGSDERTVEGEVVRALGSIGEYNGNGEWPVAFSSRTDAGVSALGNVFCIDTERDPTELLKALNAKMNDVWCLAAGEMRPGQNIRWANSRWYRYHLRPGTIKADEAKDLDSIMAVFVGDHDFRFLSKKDDEKNTRVLVERAAVIDLTGDGEMVVVDIIGTRFLHNQVRRMIGCALSVLRGDIARDELRELLDNEDPSWDGGSARDRIRTMEPDGLVLMDVHFKDIEFKLEPGPLKIAIERSSKAAWRASVSVMLHSALRSMNPY